MTIERSIYLNRLVSAKNNGKMKFLTGMRGCGKTYLLFKMFYQHLISSGVDDSHIIRLNLEDDNNSKYRDITVLTDYLRSFIQNDNESYYVLLDEVHQLISFDELKHAERFPKLYGMLNELLQFHNADIYIASSNAKLLSTDVRADLSGRSQTIHIAPLSFSEYLPVHGGAPKDAWKAYTRFGGLPHVVLEPNESAKIDYLKALKAEIFVKDINNCYGIANDIGMDDLLLSVGSSLGILTNAQRIANEFAARENKGITPPTIREYLVFLQESFLIERAERYDIKGRTYIHTPSKFYFTDVGMRNALLDFKSMDETFLMENVVYNELIYRDYVTDAGAVEIHPTENGKRLRKHLEVDFVANQGTSRYYIQTASNISDEEVMTKVQSALIKIPDSFKKLIVVTDDIEAWRNDRGFVIMNDIEFLLDEKSLDK